jgi:dCMP deaminase
MAHCIDAPCPGANEKPGEGLAICKAVHAEQNALLQCRDVYSIDSCFTTTAPCPHCLKLLMNTSCKNIYYLEDYPNKEATEETKMNWELSGMNRVLFKLPSIRIKIEILYDDEAPYNWEKF